MTEATSHVLIVDDSLTQRILLESLLKKAGYRIKLAHDGREALTAVRTEPPDLIVTDLDMPEMDGLELVRAVKVEFPKLPVVLATAMGSESIAAEALRFGASSYVPKTSLNDLVPTIQRILAITGAELATSRLAACTTYDETHFALGHDKGLASALIKQAQQIVRNFQLCDDNTVMRVSTALEEALQNAIIHGNLEVPSSLREIDDGSGYFKLAKERRQIEPYLGRRTFVTIKATPEQAEFVIRDEGPGFDVSQIPDPTNPARLDKPCGRGLWLIHAFMDEVRHNDRGNEITMILRRRTKHG
jgi:CheY-like chemotaxis protein/anti-sigma regulatory factor (Ser/Thr protein kinase)